MTDASSAEQKKRPAFQFYPGDWRKDVQLRSCSIAARGLWVDLMCVMHDCEPYGHLVLNGRAMTPAQISGQIGLPPAQVKKLLQELVDNGVARATDDGVIYSKRMVHDEQVRNARAAGGKEGAEHGQKGAEHGRKGGRPKMDKGGSETPLPFDEEPPPSSSSSSSSSNIPPTPLDEIVELYHAKLPELPQVRLRTDARVKAARKFWCWVLTSTRSDGLRRAETHEQGLTWISGYFARAATNDFLMGRRNRPGEHANWRADFDFLLTEKGRKHVIERTVDA